MLNGNLLAKMLQNHDPDALLERSRTRLRCVPIQNITLELLQREEGATPEEVADLSEPCSLHEVDFFLSHSWQDDAEEKFEALQKVREEFKTVNNGREPTIWLDKICINQCEIDEDLQCLPFFIMGCQRMLVLLGHTYPFRLWCVWEVCNLHWRVDFNCCCCFLALHLLLYGRHE